MIEIVICCGIFVIALLIHKFFDFKKLKMENEKLIRKNKDITYNSELIEIKNKDLRSSIYYLSNRLRDSQKIILDLANNKMNQQELSWIIETLNKQLNNK